MKTHKCQKKIIDETIDSHFPINLKCNKEVKFKFADSMAIFVAKDLKLFNIVNGDGFKMVAQQLISIGAKYKNININDLLPCEKIIRNHLSIVYNNIRHKLTNRLQNIKTIGITCDHWSHDITKIGHITVTIQYIADNNVKARVLSTISTDNKTASLTKQEVNTVLEKFSLEKCIQYYITDSATDKCFFK